MKDLLNRDFFINGLVEVVNKKTQDGGSCAFAIDGAWGIGKSWVLDKLERNLQGIGDDEEINVKNAKGNYFTFHYNAWENDYYDEPLIAILHTIIDKLNELYKVEHFFKSVGKGILNGFKKIIDKIFATLVGNGVTEKNENPESRGNINSGFDKYYSVGIAVKEVRKHLTNLATTQMPIAENTISVFPIIFIVDELDRCLPEYAIKVLERLHHVFNDLPHTILVLSMDQTQINHTIQKIFGDNVNKQAYLAKFIDFTVKLDDGELNEELFWKEFEEYKSEFSPLLVQTNYTYEKIWTENLFRGIPMRDRLQIVKKAKLIHSLLFNAKSKYQISVLFYEIFLVIYNRTQINDPDESEKFEQIKSFINQGVGHNIKLKTPILKFFQDNIQAIQKKYAGQKYGYRRLLDSDDYFCYTFYRYAYKDNKTAIYFDDEEIEKSMHEKLLQERDFLNFYDKYLSLIV